mmetsp:Transcript_5784/g.13326  ORF Transcript_5784/g.13326 Transcript_5784/m.13326 type:complete len:253 (+) Transcript_5784:691-1449(+)
MDHQKQNQTLKDLLQQIPKDEGQAQGYGRHTEANGPKHLGWEEEPQDNGQGQQKVDSTHHVAEDQPNRGQVFHGCRNHVEPLKSPFYGPNEVLHRDFPGAAAGGEHLPGASGFILRHDLGDVHEIQCSCLFEFLLRLILSIAVRSVAVFTGRGQGHGPHHLILAFGTSHDLGEGQLGGRFDLAELAVHLHEEHGGRIPPQRAEQFQAAANGADGKLSTVILMASLAALGVGLAQVFRRELLEGMGVLQYRQH